MSNGYLRLITCPHCLQDFDLMRDKDFDLVSYNLKSILDRKDQLAECTRCGQSFLFRLSPESRFLVDDAPDNELPTSDESLRMMACPHCNDRFDILKGNEASFLNLMSMLTQESLGGGCPKCDRLSLFRLSPESKFLTTPNPES